MMSKKQKQQKRLIRELEAALAQTLSDWAIERQVNRSLAEERDAALEDAAEQIAEKKRHNMIVDAMAEGVNRVVGERDAALADMQTLMEANAEADRTIGELRALVEQQRKDWSGDVEASREIIARKTEEYIKLRRDSADTISELRGDLAKARGELERVSACWKRAEDLLQERERELDALRDQQAQQEHAEPVVTLEAIKELEEGERLIDDDGVIIECEHVGYGVYPKIGTPYFLPGPQTTLDLYEQLKAKTMQ